MKVDINVQEYYRIVDLIHKDACEMIDPTVHISPQASTETVSETATDAAVKRKERTLEDGTSRGPLKYCFGPCLPVPCSAIF